MNNFVRYQFVATASNLSVDYLQGIVTKFVLKSHPQGEVWVS